MVSTRMKKHYENKYNFRINNCYIMPCNNDVIHENSFLVKEKYENNTFCYAGGLNVWQCIDETLSLYSQIEKKIPNSKLLLLIKDYKLGKELIKKYDIRNYSIDFVPVEELPEKLAPVKYGFIIREDSELNRVATPTKLMTYMGNGVIPILSECLEGLTENLSETDYVIKLKNTEDIKSIFEGMNTKVKINDILNDYKEIYKKHYDRETHIRRIMELLPR